MKKTTYVLGLASGVMLALNWKFFVKEGVKVSVKVGREVKKVSSQALEDLQDAKAEALQDLAEEERTARESKHDEAGHSHRPKV